MSQTQDFDANSYWEKIKNFAKEAGTEVVEKSLFLFYSTQSNETPMWAKTVVYSALAYFVLPTDAIPDFIPVVGYTDDLGALGAALATCAAYINQDVKEQARKKLKDWFD